MAIPSRSNEKEIQRRRAKADLQQFTANQLVEWSDKITAGISSWLGENQEAQRIATFAALPDEPDLSALLDLQPAREFLYPLVHADFSLSFHLVCDLSTLSSSQLGILEPNPLVHPPVLLSDAHVILCPGLAFAEDGTRLGRGKGFYDRALATSSPAAVRMGVCFPTQIHSTLPSEPHDATMTHLASKSGVHRITEYREGAV
ncbi:MAG: 5-formyltetrahydrofolate cyclo-ligase [Akkermansiaceae bacterium]|nr:5-formyltetrahydrofolate cyclo-ligase [Akkermansiaceae bacterium]